MLLKEKGGKVTRSGSHFHRIHGESFCGEVLERVLSHSSVMRRQKATFKKRAKTSAKYFPQADRRTVDERMKKYSVITGLWAMRMAGLRTVTHMTVRMTKIIRKMATAKAREGTE